MQNNGPVLPAFYSKANVIMFNDFDENHAALTEDWMKTNFGINALMLDFPNIEDCDTKEWDAIVDKFIKSSKVKKNGAIISSLSDTLPKYLRDKCLKSGVVPLQGMYEGLLAISNSIKVAKAWKNISEIKIPKTISKFKKKIKSYSEYASYIILKKVLSDL